MADCEIIIRQDGTRHLGCDESSGWIWYAAHVLLDQLLRHPCSSSSTATTTPTMTAVPLDEEHKTRLPLQNVRILELGSGTGWLALQLAQRGAIVTATERAGAVPLLLQNVYTNTERNPDLQVDVHCLDWSDENMCLLGTDGAFDLIVGSDLMYLEEYFGDLVRTILRHGAPQTMLVWEERKPHIEQVFLQTATDAGFVLDLQPVGHNPVTQNPMWALTMILRKS